MLRQKPGSLFWFMILKRITAGSARCCYQKNLVFIGKNIAAANSRLVTRNPQFVIRELFKTLYFS